MTVNILTILVPDVLSGHTVTSQEGTCSWIALEHCKKKRVLGVSEKGRRVQDRLGKPDFFIELFPNYFSFIHKYALLIPVGRPSSTSFTMSIAGPNRAVQHQAIISYSSCGD